MSYPVHHDILPRTETLLHERDSKFIQGHTRIFMNLSLPLSCFLNFKTRFLPESDHRDSSENTVITVTTETEPLSSNKTNTGTMINRPSSEVTAEDSESVKEDDKPTAVPSDEPDECLNGLDESNFDSSRTDMVQTSSNEREDSNVVFAKKENRNVMRSKILVSVVLLLATALVSFLTYYFLRKEEKQDFESQVRLSCVSSHLNCSI